MLGEYAYQQFHLDEVWYMPNSNPPHKNQIRKYEKIYTQGNAEMTRLAIEEIPYFRLCTYEMDRNFVLLSDKWSILKRLIRRMNFIFIIGADSLFNPGNLEMSGKTSENSGHPGSISG